MRALYYFSLKRKEKKDGYFTFFYFLPFKSGEEGMQKKKRKTSIFLLISLTAEKEIHKKNRYLFYLSFLSETGGKNRKVEESFFYCSFFQTEEWEEKMQKSRVFRFRFYFL